MQPPLSLTLALSVLAAALAAASCILVVPDKPAFALYDSVSLRCDERDSAAAWRVKRSTRTGGVRACLSGWGSAEPGSPCLIRNIYPSDIGMYWCESERGERSATVNITISGNLTSGPGVSQSENGRTVTGKNLKKTYYDLMGKRDGRPRLYRHRRRRNGHRLRLLCLLFAVRPAGAVPRARQRPLLGLHGSARTHLQRQKNRLSHQL